ncbi:MAG: protein-disulfide isomerase [Sphingomonas bacterium]|nr:protein-disulfide isomerase [Sphingomonas bacterium]
MSKLGIAAAIAATALSVTALPLAAAPRPATARDWSTAITKTAAGAYVMGNPRAKVRLVEYLSMTCSHCAQFIGESLSPLKANYIRTGLVSLEVRHAIRDSLDISATLIARCGGPAGFFPATETLLAQQETWIAAAIAFQEKDGGASAKLPVAQALAVNARGAGLDRIMAARGLPAAKVNACLADTKEQERLAAMAKEAWGTRSIPGTPAFLINDKLAENVSSWAALEPRLREAVR